MPTYETTEPPDTQIPVDDALAAERTHLADSRTAMRRMRERAAELKKSDAAGDWVSAEYLDSTYALRMQQLADDPTTPLFFGRLDYLPGHGPDEENPNSQRYYIGRRHIGDAAGEPMVVDWRANVSVPFYRASAKDAMGVALRRRFGFEHGELTAYEDEPLADRPQGGAHSAILEREIERPRVGPMRDIVATIQPEQDEIVRSDIGRTVCVQGAPGTGKTAVGLHRAAYLLYTHRDQLRRQRVLVIGPNNTFLRYIGDVLPALGEIEARQLTVAELVASVRVRGADAPTIATLKGDARLAEVLRRAVWSHLAEPTEGLVVSRGSRRFRVPSYRAAEMLAGIRGRGVRYAAGRAMLPQQLAHAILVRMEADGDSPDDRVQNSVARSKPVRDYANAMWPAVDGPKVLFRLFTEPAFLAECAEGILTPDEQTALLWERPPRSPGAARWSDADAVLLDELADALNRTPSVGHVVLDEAQDLSAMQLRAVGRRCSTSSATVLGDLAQATTPWSLSTWADALGHLGKSDAHLEELTEGFRVPADVIAYAARLLPRIAPGLAPPTSVRRAAGELDVITADDDAGAVAATLGAVERALSQPGSVGLVLPDAHVRRVRAALTTVGVEHAMLGEEGDIDARLDVVPASLAKGLEFDHVVVLEPAGIVAAEPDELTGLRRLYVCLTRAVSSLAVVHSTPLPEPLAA